MQPSGAIRETTDTQTSLEPVLVALEHIEARGSLLSFTHDHAQRVRLMKVMTEIELVAWNAVAKKYELTPFGCQCLAAHIEVSQASECSRLRALAATAVTLPPVAPIRSPRQLSPTPSAFVHG
jgi:hypothetical protein